MKYGQHSELKSSRTQWKKVDYKVSLDELRDIYIYIYINSDQLFASPSNLLISRTDGSSENVLLCGRELHTWNYESLLPYSHSHTFSLCDFCSAAATLPHITNKWVSPESWLECDRDLDSDRRSCNRSSRTHSGTPQNSHPDHSTQTVSTPAGVNFNILTPWWP